MAEGDAIAIRAQPARDPALGHQPRGGRHHRGLWRQRQRRHQGSARRRRQHHQMDQRPARHLAQCHRPWRADEQPAPRRVEQQRRPIAAGKCRRIDITRPLDAQSDSFWWGGTDFSAITEPYGEVQRIVRGFDRAKQGVVQSQHTLQVWTAAVAAADRCWRRCCRPMDRASTCSRPRADRSISEV